VRTGPIRAGETRVPPSRNSNFDGKKGHITRSVMATDDDMAGLVAQGLSDLLSFVCVAIAWGFTLVAVFSGRFLNTLTPALSQRERGRLSWRLRWSARVVVSNCV